MFVEKHEFVHAAATLLNVSKDAVMHAMQQVDDDENSGVNDHNPILIGDGGFCGPTSGEWCSANGFTSDTVSDGRFRAAV